MIYTKKQLEKLRRLKYFFDIDQCLMCHEKIKMTIPFPENERKTICDFMNEEYFVHCYETHGIPLEIQLDNIFNFLDGD